MHNVTNCQTGFQVAVSYPHVQRIPFIYQIVYITLISIAPFKFTKVVKYLFAVAYIQLLR